VLSARVGKTVIKVISAPGHTKGHVMFLAHAVKGSTAAPPVTEALERLSMANPSRPPADAGALFTGDTLFSGITIPRIAV
jgi:glyoxylase-like metal-dependent hydrolase (beta-lactamase superfamily II)